MYSSGQSKDKRAHTIKDAKDMILDVKYNNKQIMFLFSTEYDKVHSL
jgi:hypothetical protein